MRIRIQPYNAASRSARELSRALGAKRVHLVRTRFRPRRNDVVVNWGSAKGLFVNEIYLNAPPLVQVAGNKLSSLKVFLHHGVPHPAFTTDRAVAQEWADEGKVVVVRGCLHGHSGEGIGLVGREIEDGDHTGVVPRAPLYTLYVPKMTEYRVHVVGGKVIDIVQKRRRRDYESGADSRIRNARTGWVYCREEVNCPPVVTAAALKATAALGLDFGAVDVGYTRRSDSATVYEVNTAPGLEGTTIAGYGDSIRRLIAGRHV